MEGATLTAEPGVTSSLANFPISYSDRNTPMKSVFRSLQALNIEKANLDVKKGVRDGMGASPAKTCTAEEKMACSLDAMLNGGTCEARQ